MNADTFFTQGNSHRICQDYAIHGPDYVIVSDGCSGAPDSDFGARLLTKAAVLHLSETIIPSYDRILASSLAYCRAIDLDTNALFATLLIAKATKTDVEINIAGDGLVAIKKKSGLIDVIKINYPMSAPLYLRYFLNATDCGNFFGNYGGAYTETSYTINHDGSVQDLEVENCTFPRPDLRSFSPDFDYYKLYVVDRETTECVAIFSDGVTSFQKFVEVGAGKTMELIPEEEIIKEILSFRGYQGEFVQRRCNRAFNVFEKNGWHNFDDFSVGVIHLG